MPNRSLETRRKLSLELWFGQTVIDDAQVSADGKYLYSAFVVNSVRTRLNHPTANFQLEENLIHLISALIDNQSRSPTS